MFAFREPLARHHSGRLFDMSAKRPMFLAMLLVFGLTGLLLMWPTPRKQVGGLSVTFVGLTNDGSGKLSAQFSVANHFPRRVRFGACEVQVCQTNGWPNAVRVAGGAAWLPVAPGGEHIFSVPPPPREQASWRVPLMYQEDLSFIDNVRFRIDLLAWAIPRWRPGKPAPVRNGDGFHRSLLAYGPEMGRSVEPGRSAKPDPPVRPETNRTSVAAGSGR